jgi:hypothetical protein
MVFLPAPSLAEAFIVQRTQGTGSHGSQEPNRDLEGIGAVVLQTSGNIGLLLTVTGPRTDVTQSGIADRIISEVVVRAVVPSFHPTSERLQRP